MNNDRIIQAAKKLLPYMSNVRRHIHENPETGFDCKKTMSYIKEKLAEMSIEAQYVGKCGLTANIGQGKMCVLLRADTDALDLCEETDEPFASENGKMHACGHDMHTAMLLGAARILKENEEKLGCTVKLMFQSAEELLCGAKDMLDSGVLSEPAPSAAMMIHVMTDTDMKTGTLVIPKDGEGAPAADFFEITVQGKGVHGSSPFLGRDPVYAAANIITALSEISSRELAMSESAALTVCSVHGGENANVIPNKATMSGTMRCFGEDTRQYIRQRLCEISENTAKTFRTDASVNFNGGCPSLVNDKRLCKTLFRAFRGCFGDELVINAADMPTKTVAGSEDFSYITQKIPSVMIALASGERCDGHIYPLHHPKVTFNENAMIYGCAAFLLFVSEMAKENVQMKA